jgi:hypothetical protein
MRDTLTIPQGNNVSGRQGNYVSATPLARGNR